MLEAKVHRLEDEVEVRNVLISYGFAADTGDAERVGQRFTEDGVYDVSGRAVMDGRADVEKMILGPGHQSLLPNCAHTFGPSVVKIDGDGARVTGYTRTYHRSGDDYGLWRLSFTNVEMVRRDGRWRIARRTNRLVGSEEAGAVFRQGLAELEG